MHKQFITIIQKCIAYLANLGTLIGDFLSPLDWNARPEDPKGDVRKLRIALQQATNSGEALRISGDYLIASGIHVRMNQDLFVDATEARFIASSQLDADMFSLDACQTKKSSDSSSPLARVHWNGGYFDMSRAKVSTVVPYTRLTLKERQGRAKTADALSIRGVVKEGEQGVCSASVQNITFVGTSSHDDPFYLAGGDSGLFIGGVSEALIKNNSFYGVRDAAIYVSADGFTGSFGGHYTIENNYIERAFDAVTSKRGASNIKMIANTMKDVVVGLSVKRAQQQWIASTIEISENTITTSARAISIEGADEVSIEKNCIHDLGTMVSGREKPLNKFGDCYEGISLNGVCGDVSIRDNRIHGQKDSLEARASKVYGIVTRSEHGRETQITELQGNTYDNLDVDCIAL